MNNHRIMSKAIFRYSILVILFIIAVLTSCTGSDNLSSKNVYDEDSAVVEIIPELYSTTGVSRAGIADVLQEFYLTAFSGSFNRGRNIHYLYDGNQWTSDRTITWPTGTNTISFWALSQRLEDGNGITNSKFTASEQYFDFTSDPLAPKDLMIASSLNTNRERMNGKVHLGFNYSLAYPFFTCVQGIEDVTINIKEVTVHNISTTGTLAFDKSTNSMGKWTLVDGLYGNYTQTLDNPVTLNPDLNTAEVISSKWYWIPQRPVKWTTTDEVAVPISVADENHECYVELKCQIIKDGSYLWGAASGENEYESVYYPFGTNFRTVGYSRAIKLSFTGGYLADGTPFKPHDSSGEFTIADWVTLAILVDPWEEMDPEDLIF